MMKAYTDHVLGGNPKTLTTLGWSAHSGLGIESNTQRMLPNAEGCRSQVPFGHAHMLTI